MTGIMILTTIDATLSYALLSMQVSDHCLGLPTVRLTNHSPPRASASTADAVQPEPEEPLFAELCAASVQGRVALGRKSGAAVERIGRRGRAERPLFVPGELCCDIERFSLHAKVLIAGADREGLERLCRYIARPPIKVERLSLDADGRMIYAPPLAPARTLEESEFAC